MNAHAKKAVFHEMEPISGFYDFEHDFWGPFVWARKRFAVRRVNNGNYYSLELCYYGTDGKLFIGDQGESSSFIRLHPGWNTYPLDLSMLRSTHLVFQVSEAPPVHGDTRELGVMIRRFRPLSDHPTAEQVGRVLDNGVRNHGEFTRGTIRLETHPRKILISMAGTCTMKSRCVYCDRDRTIPLEEVSGFSFSPVVLDELGDFYELAGAIGDNSRGEPLLCRDLGVISSRTDKNDKLLEIVTNGQVLGENTRDALLGKKVGLYASIDSANPAGYSRYRDDQFDRVLQNLRELCRAKKKSYNLPTVLTTFVSMRSNMGEIEAFLDLMKDVGVDGVKLRTLNRDPYLMDRRELRNGYWFDYANELLNTDERRGLEMEAKKLARSKDVPLIADWDFTPPVNGDNGPLCSEPWEAMQILNVGIVSCIFARNWPMATWSARGDRPLDQFLWDVWNGDEYRQIRTELAAGRIPDHCARCESCPIVSRWLNRDHMSH